MGVSCVENKVDRMLASVRATQKHNGGKVAGNAPRAGRGAHISLGFHCSLYLTHQHHINGAITLHGRMHLHALTCSTSESELRPNAVRSVKWRPSTNT